MTYFFRCIKNTGPNETIEKVFIDTYNSVKFNMGIELPLNGSNKYAVYQKLKRVLTNGEKTPVKNDQNIKHQCRGKCQDCYPVYQPSQYLKDAINPYQITGLKQANYQLSGVNLCAHEHPNKPDQTHVELYFRNPNEPHQRVVVNIHLNFTHDLIDPAHTHHSILQRLLAATASSASIAHMLGKACQRGLERLANEHSVLAQLNESNHECFGFRAIRQHRSALNRYGIFQSSGLHAAHQSQPFRSHAM